MPDQLRLHRLAWKVRNLGYGTRLTVWTQGCEIGCPGCCSVDSHPMTGGSLRTVGQWMTVIRTVLGKDAPDGLTVSGGEPTLQSVAVAKLIYACRRLFPGIDVLLYSGLSWERIEGDFGELSACCDVVVSEPFMAGVPPVSALHGSGNQKIHLLTALGEERYRDRVFGNGSNSLSVTGLTGRKLTAVGIPEGNSIRRLSEALARRGVTLEKPSWRR